ncbi:MAG: ribonuclease H-like domain-containing protein, partial [Gemmatimonadetes bacterium]|nr:ribonuclease H-like domain-containing protein [Gemmatimonadota bacterium]
MDVSTITEIAKEKKPAESDLSKYVTGSYVPTSSGELFLARHTYDLDHIHGDYEIGSIDELNGKDLKILSPTGSEFRFDHRKVLFLDTETTGLAGGTGTAAFLIGLGYFLGNKFIVEQLFMRDYDEEAPMLNLLADKAKDFDQIVTFNGRSFDLPLLETRMILNRIEPALSRLRDIDLLHPARRIWGLSLSDCRLGTLEEEI